MVQRVLLRPVIAQALAFGTVDWDPLLSGVTLGALSHFHGHSLEHRKCLIRVFPLFHTLSLAKKQFLESQESRDKTELSLRRVDIRLSLAILDCPKKLQG